MKIPRPRLTVRRLMIAVALAGVALGGLAFVQRRRDHARAMAKYHRARHEVERDISPRDEDRGIPLLNKRAIYHGRLWMKWEDAHDRPWLPFEADPPEPE